MESENTEELRRELSRTRATVEALRAEVRELQAATLHLPVAAGLAVGLLVLLATTWLVPTGSEEQVVHDFAGARTGLGLLAGPWQSTEPVRQWLGVAAVAVYVVCVLVALFAVHASPRWVPVVAAGLGLVATLVVLGTKPGAVESVDWAYAWRSPPYVAAALWALLAAVTGQRAAAARG